MTVHVLSSRTRGPASRTEWIVEVGFSTSQGNVGTASCSTGGPGPLGAKG